MSCCDRGGEREVKVACVNESAQRGSEQVNNSESQRRHTADSIVATDPAFTGPALARSKEATVLARATPPIHGRAYCLLLLVCQRNQPAQLQDFDRLCDLRTWRLSPRLPPPLSLCFLVFSAVGPVSHSLSRHRAQPITTQCSAETVLHRGTTAQHSDQRLGTTNTADEGCHIDSSCAPRSSTHSYSAA